VKLLIMGFIRRFMPKKIAVSSCLKIFFIGFFGFFPNGKGDGAIRKFFFDCLYNLYDPLIRKIRILASL